MIKDEWVKSSRSNGNGGNNCVQVRAASGTGTTFVRDSKHGGVGPVLKFTSAEWQAFIDGVKSGEFDL